MRTTIKTGRQGSHRRGTVGSVLIVALAFLVSPTLSSGAPIPVPDHYATFEGVTLEVPAPGLISNDLHLEGRSFILSQFFSPSNGTLPSIVTNGAFTYVPNPGFVGTDQFSYRLLDEEGNFSEFVSVTIEVLPDPNRPPVVVPDFYGTFMDTPFGIAAPGLIANDFDPDGDSFILSQFFSPTHGTLPSIVTNGAFTYIPPPGFVGTDQFTYRLADEKGLFSEFGPVSISVFPHEGTDPIAVEDAYATFAGVTLQIAAPGLIANDLHPEGKGFILSQFFSPTHGTLPSIVTSGAFTYVPPPGFVGTDQFRYRLQDVDGNFSEFITVTIEVVPDPNRPPVPITDSYGTPMDTPLVVAAPGLIANDFDPDGDSFILSQFFSPTHGTLSSIVTSGAFTYIPPPGFSGVDHFQYRLQDEKGAFSEFIEVTIHVLGPPDMTPPEIVVREEPIVLWPPNRKSHLINLSEVVLQVLDEGDPDLSPDDVLIIAVDSDEPADEGDTPDISISSDCRSVALRANRRQPGDGRVYTVHLAVADNSGNVGIASFEVHVPLNVHQLALKGETAYTVISPCNSTSD